MTATYRYECLICDHTYDSPFDVTYDAGCPSCGSPYTTGHEVYAAPATTPFAEALGRMAGEAKEQA